MVGDTCHAQGTRRTAITPSTYCIIVTRGHSHDEEVSTIRADERRPRGHDRQQRKIADLRRLDRQGHFRNHTAAGPPLGLEIGSQTVPEIAVSIVAERLRLQRAKAMIYALIPAAGKSTRGRANRLHCR